MATFDYARTRATADRLITKFGQAAIIRRITGTSGEAWDPSVTETDYDCVVAVTGFQKIESGNVQAGDKIIEVSAVGLDVEPTPKDKIVIDGAVHAIIRVEPLNPGGTIVKYLVFARE